MSDPLINLGAGIKHTAVGASNAILPIMIFIGILGLFCLAIWFIVQELSYKHKFKIITLTNGVEQVVLDRCKIIKDDKGIEVIKIKKKRLEAPFPPNDAIQITNKGKFFFEARYSPDRGFEYIFPDNKKHQISTEAFTTDQKAFMVYQGEKAERNRKNGIAQLIKESVPYIALVIIIATLFVFWGDITEPTVQMAEKNIQYQNQQLKILEILQNMENDIQELKSSNSGEVPD